MRMTVGREEEEGRRRPKKEEGNVGEGDREVIKFEETD